MKKVLTFLIIVIALILTLSIVISAEDVIYSGTWGDLTWEFNETTGELTISGEGEMDGLSNSTTEAWLGYRRKIKSVIIEDGVTSIGEWAFSTCGSLTSITIPDSVTSIGNYTFYFCRSLTRITIPDSVISIGNYAFTYCESLESITIPDSVTSVSSFAFSNCSSLTSIHFNGTKAQWAAMKKGGGWDSNTGNYTVYCTDGNITK